MRSFVFSKFDIEALMFERHSKLTTTLRSFSLPRLTLRRPQQQVMEPVERPVS